MTAARHAHNAAPVLMTAQRGGDAALTSAKMHPSEIALTLSADVLRLPYLPAFRLVLAEIVSLYASNGGRCDASDKHFADRLTISTDTASRAVQQLVADGLVTKNVQRLPTGFYRTLAPNAEAISAKAQTNPYPQNAGSTPQSAGREATRKMPVAYRQSAGSPTRRLPVALPADCGSNTPLDIPLSFQGKQAAGEDLENLEELASLAEQPADASHTEGGAADVGTSKPVGPRGWGYDPAAIAETLVLPFESPEFRAAWVKYRTYREEEGYRRLAGGLQEQEALRKLGTLAAGNEQLALDIISQTIEKGWQGLFKLDKSNATARQSSPNGRPAAGAGRVETLNNYGSNRRPQQAGPISGAA
jgi:hypothetical protein